MPRARMTELEIIANISASLSTATTLEEIVQALALPGTNRVTLFTFESDAAGQPQWMEVRAAWAQTGTSPLAVGSRFYLPDFPFVRLDLENPTSPLLIGHTGHEARIDLVVHGSLLPHPTQAIAMMPLALVGRWIGLVAVCWPVPCSFSAGDRRLYQVLAGQVAAVVDNRLRLLQVEYRAAQLEELVEVLRSGQDTGSFLDAIIENIPLAVFVKDAERLEFVRWNRGSEELFGFKREEMLGKSDYDFFPKEQADFAVAKDREVLASGQFVDVPEARLQTADKSTRTVHTRKVPLLDADGRPRYLLGVSEDITERKQVEQALRQQAQIIDQIHDAVISTDLNGYVTSWNKGAERLFGYGAEEMLFQHGSFLYAEGEYERLQQVVTGVLEEEDYREVEVRMRLKSGEEFYASQSLSLVRDEQGNRAGFISSSVDITARKEAAAALARRAVEMEAVAQVGTAATTILSVDKLLQTVVDLTQTRFNLYHAHIYLLDEVGDMLVLAAGAGEPGRQMVAQGWQIRLDHEQSLVAHTARTRQGLIVNDVRQAPDFLPNPLLPETRSEMTVPLVVGEQLLGVLDVQANMVNAFTDEDLRIQATLAAQIAVALQNAELYQQTQAALAETEHLYMASQTLAAAASEGEIVSALVEQVDRAQLDRVMAALVTATGEEQFQVVVRAAWDRAGETGELLGRRLSGRQIPLLARLDLHESLLEDNLAAPNRVDETSAAVLHQLGGQSVALLPISTTQRLFGWLLLATAAPHSFSQEEVRPALTLAGQAAVAIENRRLLQEAQARARREQVLREITARVRSSPDPDVIARTAIRELGTALNRPAFIRLQVRPNDNRQE